MSSRTLARTLRNNSCGSGSAVLAAVAAASITTQLRSARPIRTVYCVACSAGWSCIYLQRFLLRRRFYENSYFGCGVRYAHRRRARVGAPFFRGRIRREETGEGLGNGYEDGVDESPLPLLYRREGRQRQSHQLELRA